MTPISIFSIFLGYTALLFFVAWITGRKADNETFFVGNHKSPWYVVAYGMIGASLSGVTFISVPGDVGSSNFSYMVIVLGYLLGYYVIANVLLPVYYRLKLTSIYTYLDGRFGRTSYHTGAFFFLLSRVIGASFRMFLVVNVLHLFVFQAWGIPFGVSVVVFVALILLYTFRGGIRTIVWTDTLQTTFMLLSVIVVMVLMARHMHLDFSGLLDQVFASDYAKMFNTDINNRHNWIKQFFSGAFIAIVMTGLDQDMMQKNLTCRNLKEAKKNIYWLSISLVPVNFLFLILGVTLYLFAQSTGFVVQGTSDELFPAVALQQLGPLAGIIFVIGLISAAYSSADSALTALTTSFCVDFLGFERKTEIPESVKVKTRYRVHLVFAALITLVIMGFRAINDQSVISKLFTVAGYTYGPLLGLFAFGLFTRRRVNDRWVPFVAVIAPSICYILSVHSQAWFWGYRFGFELLILNGMLTFFGLLIVSVSAKKTNVR